MPSKLFASGLLDGQVAIVSGGGSGLGRASALELAACGAHVVVCGRRLEPLEETVASADGGRCEAQVCDIREEDQVSALVDGVLERHGRIDLLVNNAGGQYLTPAEDITPKGFRTVIGLNVEGTWLMTHAVATRAMIPEARGGKIMNVTLSPHNGLPGMAHSSAARAAVENLTRVLASAACRALVPAPTENGVRRSTIQRRADPTNPMPHPATIGDFPHPVVRRDLRSVSRQQSPFGRIGQQRLVTRTSG